MTITVVLKRGRMTTFDGATLTPPTFTTPYYLVETRNGRTDYFAADAIEQITVIKPVAD